jgi:hypothetical protein
VTAATHPRRLPARAIGLCVVLALRAALSRAGAEPVSEPSAAIGLDTAFDSNVYNGRGRDFVVRVQPRLGWHLRDRRTDFALAYEVGIWTYADGKAQSSINQRFGARLDTALTRRLHLAIADELTSAHDPGFLIRTGVVAPQTGIFDNLLESSLAVRASRRLEVGLAYAFHHTSFDEQVPPLPPLHDGDEHDASASLSFRAGHRDDLRFLHRFQYFTVDGDGFATTHSPAVGWRHVFTRIFDLRLEAGPLIYQAMDGARREIPGSAGTAVTWRGAGVLRVNLYPWRFVITAVRDLVSGTGAGTVLWADYGTLQLGYWVERHVLLHAAVGLFENGFAPTGDRRYDGVTADGAADIHLSHNLHLVPYYSFRWQETHDGGPLLPVTRHVAGVRLLFVVGAEAGPHHEVHW